MSIIMPSRVFEGSDLGSYDSWRRHMLAQDWRQNFNSATGKTFTRAYYLNLDLEMAHKETVRHLSAMGIVFSKKKFWLFASNAWNRAAQMDAENKRARQEEQNSEEAFADE